MSWALIEAKRKKLAEDLDRYLGLVLFFSYFKKIGQMLKTSI